MKTFDALFQTCMIDMAVGFLDLDTVRLIPGRLNMTQKTDMTLFQLTHWNLNVKSPGEGLRVTITMQRIFTSEVMTTYFPSLLLTAISFATTFFKPFFFEAALSVNLTTMLVMTTIFISKMEGLPPTSDIKMIDIWLILCQMVPFAEVVLLTAMEYHRRDDSHGRDGNMLKDISFEAKERWFQMFWVPHLSTIGDIPDDALYIYLNELLGQMSKFH